MIRALWVWIHSHNSFSVNPWGPVEQQREPLTQIMVVLFLPLFGDHSCVVLCQEKIKHKGERIDQQHTLIWELKDNKGKKKKRKKHKKVQCGETQSVVLCAGVSQNVDFPCDS